MNSAIEAFEREFAPWALKLPAADVAARRNGQLRANGWSVLYEFGSDAYGDYLDYYAALREATDARVNDDWHARIYETGQVVAFPAVLEAYLYGRDPSQEELDRARGPVLESLSPSSDDAAPDEAPPPVDSDIGSADTALWADLRDVVEGDAPLQSNEPPRRPSAETPAEIDNLLDAAFGDVQIPEPIKFEPPPDPEPLVVEKPAVVAKPVVAEKPVVVDKPKKEEEPVEEPVEEEPAIIEAPAAPRRSVPGYDPFVELRTLEPKSARHAPPTGDDFRPLWQKYPARTAGVAVALAAVILVAVVAMSHGGSKPAKRIAATDTTSAPTTPATDTTPPASTPAPDTQTVGTQADTPDTATASTPTPAPVATPTSSSPNESSIAKPVGPGSIAPIVRARPSGS